jgi:hypothetical protein
VTADSYSHAGNFAEAGLAIFLFRNIAGTMKLHELQSILAEYPNTFPRFVLPDGDYIPAHAHVTEVGHLIRNFIDCGGLTGKEEKIVLQTTSAMTPIIGFDQTASRKFCGSEIA